MKKNFKRIVTTTLVASLITSVPSVAFGNDEISTKLVSEAGNVSDGLENSMEKEGINEEVKEEIKEENKEEIKEEVKEENTALPQLKATMVLKAPAKEKSSVEYVDSASVMLLPKGYTDKDLISTKIINSIKFISLGNVSLFENTVEKGKNYVDGLIPENYIDTNTFIYNETNVRDGYIYFTDEGTNKKYKASIDDIVWYSVKTTTNAGTQFSDGLARVNGYVPNDKWVEISEAPIFVYLGKEDRSSYYTIGKLTIDLPANWTEWQKEVSEVGDPNNSYDRFNNMRNYLKAEFIKIEAFENDKIDTKVVIEYITNNFDTIEATLHTDSGATQYTSDPFFSTGGTNKKCVHLDFYSPVYDYTVVYNSNYPEDINKTNENYNDAVKTFESDYSVKSVEDVDFKAEGYEFKGFVDKDGNEVGDKLTFTTSDKTKELYAKWEKKVIPQTPLVNEYKVIYNSNYPKAINKADKKVEDKTTETEFNVDKNNNQGFEAEGYVFKGFVDKDGNLVDKITFTTTETTIEVFAKWEKKSTPIVEDSDDNGSTGTVSNKPKNDNTTEPKEAKEIIETTENTPKNEGSIEKTEVEIKEESVPLGEASTALEDMPKEIKEVVEIEGDKVPLTSGTDAGIKSSDLPLTATAPKTGDNVMMYAPISIITGFLTVALSIFKKKESNN